jgi:adenylate kinase
MKLILIATADRQDEDSLIIFNLERSRNLLPDFECIMYEDFVDATLAGQQMLDKLNERLEKASIDALKSNSNVILAGRLTVPGRAGYVPLISERFFEKFRPDMILLFERDTSVSDEFLVRKRFGSREGIEGVAEQQQLNRSFASDYAARSGASVKIIKINEDLVKDTIRELVAVLTLVMEKP